MKKLISAWHYPTTVIFVDDNPNFLESIFLGLDTEIMVPKFFTDPFEAKQFLSSEDPKNQGINKLNFLSVETQGATQQNVSVDLGRIHQEIYNSSRFSEVSLVVVDYAMPKLNGLDFCKQILSLEKPFKILMLTGEADDELAVDAFNNKIIDHFMRKKAGNDGQFQNSLNEAIKTLQDSYFYNLSKRVIDNLTEEKESPQDFYIKDVKFIELFNAICKENNIAEYYILDTDGSFLLLDFNGNPMLFFVKSEQSMEDAYQVAFNADEPFPKEILKSMKNHEKILCLYEQEICDDYSEAKKYLYPTQKFIGKEVCYYALVKDIAAYNIDKKKILGFKKYSENFNSNL